MADHGWSASRAKTALAMIPVTALALMALSCARAIDDAAMPATGPTVADARFGGQRLVTALTVSANVVDVGDALVFDIDTEFGALAVDTPCGTLYGSFSFFDDGGAGVTIAGRSPRPCEPESEELVSQLLAALGRVSEWSETVEGFALASGSGDAVVLQP